jgi:tRNA 2-thiouridine synthesizing protein A
MEDVKADHLLDARGALCPMPVVQAGKAIKALEPGQVLKVLVTDRGAIADFPAWAEDTGNHLLHWHEEDGALAFWFRKGDAQDVV